MKEKLENDREYKTQYSLLTSQNYEDVADARLDVKERMTQAAILDSSLPLVEITTLKEGQSTTWTSNPTHVSDKSRLGDIFGNLPHGASKKAKDVMIKKISVDSKEALNTVKEPYKTRLGLHTENTKISVIEYNPEAPATHERFTMISREETYRMTQTKNEEPKTVKFCYRCNIDHMTGEVFSEENWIDDR